MCLLLLSVVAGMCFYSQWRGVSEENNELRSSCAALRAQVDKLQKEWEFKNEYYNRLLSDSEFSERIIREKLGYAYPNDIVFRFKDSEPVDDDNDNDEKSEHVSVPKKELSFIDKVFAFFGGSKQKDVKDVVKKKVDDNPVAPKFRIDMTNASVAAVENKARQNALNAPTISSETSNFQNAQQVVNPPENVSLLADSVGRGVLVEAKSKPVKVKLGGGNASVAFSPLKAPKPVRFLSR